MLDTVKIPEIDGNFKRKTLSRVQLRFRGKEEEGTTEYAELADEPPPSLPHRGRSTDIPRKIKLHPTVQCKLH
jgi:hypothetical protein